MIQSSTVVLKRAAFRWLSPLTSSSRNTKILPYSCKPGLYARQGLLWWMSGWPLWLRQSAISDLALLVDKKLWRTEIIFHSTMSRLISTIFLFDYKSRYYTKMREKVAGMCKWRFLLRANWHFEAQATFQSGRECFLQARSAKRERRKDTLGKRSLRKTEDRNSAQNVEIIILDDLGVGFSGKKSIKTMRSTTTLKIATERAKNAWWHPFITAQKNELQPFTTMGGSEKAEEAKKSMKETVRRAEPESRLLI